MHRSPYRISLSQAPRYQARFSLRGRCWLNPEAASIYAVCVHVRALLFCRSSARLILHKLFHPGSINVFQRGFRVTPCSAFRHVQYSCACTKSCRKCCQTENGSRCQAAICCVGRGVEEPWVLRDEFGRALERRRKASVDEVVSLHQSHVDCLMSGAIVQRLGVLRTSLVSPAQARRLPYRRRRR